MKYKTNLIRSGMNLLGLSGRRFSVRLCLVAVAVLALQANSVFAHPGHDHHAPQSGIMHWLLAPAHAIPILTCLGFGVGFAIWKLRSANRRSITVDIDPSKR
jgi:hydrogenase/urease accessory protein HupE